MAQHSNASAATLNPVVLLFLPTLYALGATISLLQFQVVLNLITRGIAKAKSISALASVYPVLSALSEYLTKVFGPVHKFAPQPTHVYLIAILIAIIVHLERIATARR